MSKHTTAEDPRPSFLDEQEDKRLLDLFSYLDERVPAAYRSEVLSHLLPRALPALRGREIPARPPRLDRPASGDGMQAASDRGEMSEIEPYAAILSRRGETLLKALAALHLAATSLAVQWMTPAEIARLLGEIDDAHSVYRSNVSNALRKEKSLVTRRQRGRGYEYGLTTRGRARVERELLLLGFEVDDEHS